MNPDRMPGEIEKTFSFSGGKRGLFPFSPIKLIEDEISGIGI
jgi:hypothetical protein